MENTASSQKARILTLVFTDLVNSTALKSEKGDQVVSGLIARHRKHVQTISSETHGRVIDWAGDGCFLTFETSSAATLFALRLQEVHLSDLDLPSVRIGVHMGEVSESDGPDESTIRVEGLAVDLTARIESLAKPGQILMSSAVFNSVRQRLRGEELSKNIVWLAHGAYEFKGFDDTLEICEAGLEGLSPLVAPEGSEKAHRAVTPSEEETLGWRPAAGLTIPGRKHWVLEEQLGEGGFGEVWLASHETTHARRVFKFCFQADRVRGLKREVVLFRLLKEALGERDDIARILDWEFEKPPFFLEADYTDGGDLKVWAEEHGSLANIPLNTRIDIVAQVATALDAAHSAGVLHKDIKPANILVRTNDEHPRACLTDFGIGLLTDPDSLKNRGITSTGLTQTLAAGNSTSTSGTAMYMAPEIFEGKPPSERSDIFALGVILYQILVGDFHHAMAPGWERDVQDAALREDIASCVDGNPDNRLARAGLLAERLGALPTRRRRAAQRRFTRRASVAAVALLVITAFTYLFVRPTEESRNTERVTWARETAIPEIKSLIQEEQFRAAFDLAREAERVIPNDPIFAELWPQMSTSVSIATSPPDASVYYKPYDQPNAEWTSIGKSDVESHIPFGAFRWKFEKAGYDTVIRANVVTDDPIEMHEPLHKSGTVPEGMIAIPAGPYWIPITGFMPGDQVMLGDYYIDRTEVSNRDYKEFVDAGGYKMAEYWTHAFIEDGRELSVAEAVDRFVDATGSQGPAGWEVGNYPAGTGDHPVGGLSWYEAAAYAEFRDKSLPTIFHWIRAALPAIEIARPLSPSIIPQSNFASDSSVPVATNTGIGVSGAYDMAGNVREWCWSEQGGNRFSLGGAWDDPVYMFTLASAASPWDRSPGNGFRCVKYDPNTPPDGRLLAEVEVNNPDFYNAPLMSDEAFEVVREQHAYDRTPLNPTIAESKSSSEEWRVETVTIDATYNSERFDIHIALPVDAKLPHKTVIFFPGLSSIYPQPLEESWDQDLGFFMRSGRALVYPIYDGTYDRSDGTTAGAVNETRSRRDYIVRWGQDLNRVVDYLETRDDIEMTTLAFCGFSFGATVGQIILPLEERIQVAVLVSGGFSPIITDAQYPARYARRLTIPVVMVNGRYDYVFPHDTHQRPLFDLLGTPAENKRHVVTEDGHIVGRNTVIRESLDWLDTYAPLDRRVPTEANSSE